jgi:flavin-binding protein dodecin
MTRELRGENAVSNVAKVIEVNTASTKGFEDAVQSGLTRIAKTVENIQGAWVSDIKVTAAPDGKIKEWRVCMRVTFIVD